MKLRKHWNKEYREFSITVICPSGERAECYNGAVYQTEACAQKYADQINAGRVEKYGRAIVESRMIPAQWVWQGRISL